MRRYGRALVMLIVLLLAGCDHLLVRGAASEHGVERMRVGVPL